MGDARDFWQTKTFWGAVGFALLVLFNALGIDLPYEQLTQVVTVWTGYSIADRLRK